MNTYVKPVRLWLKSHPALNEKWVQRLIADDPSILGLGDLVLRDQERPQPNAGRLTSAMPNEHGDCGFQPEERRMRKVLIYSFILIGLIPTVGASPNRQGKCSKSDDGTYLECSAVATRSDGSERVGSATIEILSKDIPSNSRVAEVGNIQITWPRQNDGLADFWIYDMKIDRGTGYVSWHFEIQDQCPSTGPFRPYTLHMDVSVVSSPRFKPTRHDEDTHRC